MNDREKYIAAHYNVGFKTQLRFQLLNEIGKHQSLAPCVWNDNEKIIDELASEISDGCLNRYNIDDEFIREKYGVSDMATAMLLREIAFYKAGRDASVAHPSPTMDYLADVEENMGDVFFDGYKPERDSLAKLIEELNGKALCIAGESRCVEYRKDALQELCRNLDTEHNEDEIIKKMNLYNDGSYIVPPPAVCALSGLLREYAYWEEYYRLLEVLRYFPLQGSLIKGIGNVKDIMDVIKVADAHNGCKSLHYLMREQCFAKLCEEAIILEQNAKNRHLPDQDRSYIESVLENFKSRRSEYIKEMTDIWLSVFGKEQQTDWLSRKESEAEQKPQKFRAWELEIVKMMSEAYVITPAEISAFNLDNKSYFELITLARIVDDKDVCGQIVKALQKSIFSDDFYPPTTINDTWLEQARVVYRCLNKSGVDGLSMLKEKRRPFEGYRVDLSASMHNVKQEAYWMAILLLSLEDSWDENVFENICNVLFRDTKFAIESLTDDVFAPYYVAELLVSQVGKSEKDAFEMKIIEEIPYLVFIIRVLTGNGGGMSSEINQLVKEKITAEWEVERRLLGQRKMVNLEFYDEYVGKVLNR